MIFILFGAILPFILWPIEYFFPHPQLVEEVAKAIIVLALLTYVSGRRLQIYYAIAIGVLFAVSESVLYLFNILLVGSPQDLAIRLLLTIPLHVASLLIILILGMRRRIYIVIGIVITIFIHYFFNLIVGRF